MRLLIPVLVAAFWSAACVVIKFDTKPPEKSWKIVPEVEFDTDGCCENEDEEPDLKKGPHHITFTDWINPWLGWEIEYYELYNQWGDVVVKISPNKRGLYVVKGVPAGCYRLRAIGRGWRERVPSAPTPEACTPGLTSGRIWT